MVTTMRPEDLARLATLERNGVVERACRWLGLLRDGFLLQVRQEVGGNTSAGARVMTDAEILASLGPVVFEPSCVVAVDDSEVVRHAAPLDDQARAQLLEQYIASLQSAAACRRSGGARKRSAYSEGP